ncbi:hypothetical protein [Rhodoferax sp. GW822-FHT02A01]|uniref:hypothetical protein n=1 Tax=Rhodoferax sp. GW822-FHT02A01 TaxID=3141537 RepID=UPI00315D7725
MIERFKSLSRLDQGLVAIESQLQKLFALAYELAVPAEDVIVLQDIAKHRSISNAAAIDVMAWIAKAAKKVKAAKTAGRKVAAAEALTANDAKLLSHLQGILKSDMGTAVTGAALAAGVMLPLGSVGISLKRVLVSGTVKLGGHGIFQLGESSVNTAADAEPGKKMNAVAKKGITAKAEKAVSKPAKSKVAPRTKAALKVSKVI